MRASTPLWRVAAAWGVASAWTEVLPTGMDATQASLAGPECTARPEACREAGRTVEEVGADVGEEAELHRLPGFLETATLLMLLPAVLADRLFAGRLHGRLARCLRRRSGSASSVCLETDRAIQEEPQGGSELADEEPKLDFRSEEETASEVSSCDEFVDIPEESSVGEAHDSKFGDATDFRPSAVAGDDALGDHCPHTGSAPPSEREVPSQLLADIAAAASLPGSRALRLAKDDDEDLSATDSTASPAPPTPTWSRNSSSSCECSRSSEVHTMWPAYQYFPAWEMDFAIDELDACRTRSEGDRSREEACVEREDLSTKASTSSVLSSLASPRESLSLASPRESEESAQPQEELLPLTVAEVAEALALASAAFRQDPRNLREGVYPLGHMRGHARGGSTAGSCFPMLPQLYDCVASCGLKLLRRHRRHPPRVIGT